MILHAVGWLVIFVILPVVLIRTLLLAVPPQIFPLLLWSLATLSGVAVLLRLVVHATIPAYVGTDYRHHDVVVLLLLGVTGMSVLLLLTARFRRTLRAWWDGGMPVLLWAAALILWMLTPRYPTEWALRQHFEERRPELEQLVAMLREDRYGRSKEHEFSSLEDAEQWKRLPSERLRLYRKLLKRVGVLAFMAIDDSAKTVSVDFPGSGRWVQMHEGYEYDYGSRVPTLSSVSLDTPCPQFIARYRNLAPPWYLYDYNGGVPMP